MFIRVAVIAVVGLLMVSACNQSASTEQTSAPSSPPSVFATQLAITAAPTVSAPDMAPVSQSTPTFIVETKAPAVVPTLAPPAALAPDGGPITAANFADARHGWLALGQTILATVDGGQGWAARAEMSGIVEALDFVSSKQGWALVEGGIFVSRDGGTTWQKLETGIATAIREFDFVDNQHGWIQALRLDATDQIEQVFLRTTDGGTSWTTTTNPCVDYDTFAFSFINSKTGWVLCAGEPGVGHQAKRLLKTNDGGQQWSEVDSVTIDSNNTPGRLSNNGYIADLFFFDTLKGWISTTYGGDSTLMVTADGARSWQILPYIDLGSLKTLIFVSPDHGYILARKRDGFTGLFGTTDGGRTWVQRYPTDQSAATFNIAR